MYSVLIFSRLSLGEMPLEVGNLNALETFNVQENRIGETIATFVLYSFLTDSYPHHHIFNILIPMVSASEGPIPTQIGQLTGLTQLVMTKNFFNSAVPTEIGNLVNLETLSLNFNRLTGQIPDEITQLGGLIEAFLEINCE